MQQTLNQIFEAALSFNGLDFYQSRVPGYIYSNLKKDFGKRPYQQEAFGRFVYYLDGYHARPKGVPTQLLFHMATGSGKTLIMAGLIIYLYSKGYRNFLFFVNSTNIIDKTRDNFLNKASSKYLFSETISIGDKQISIKEVENFQAVNNDDINIVFSTIQGLHTRLNTPKENSLTYDDFEDKKIVLISDEAHHINAETKSKISKLTSLNEDESISSSKKLSPEEKEEIISWEGTVNRILNANKDNFLLEFTATADLSVPEIKAKYDDKLLFDYPLKQFRLDGFSKEVKVLQADLEPFKRSLQSVLLSQYRRKVFEKNKKIIKPVILFKSKTIKESEIFFNQFIEGMKSLRVSDLNKIKKSTTDEVIEKLFNYFEANGITLENLITELKEDFSVEKLISVNSKDDSEQKQLIVNSLEDRSNEYRAVFAVDKLNEGWDVLNLFDIVRLYDTRDSKDGRPGKTTMSEAQLIGRGARYCPFKLIPEQSLYTRKFDGDLKNELRICEELYYHSSYNPKYISELNTALEEIGIKARETKECELKLKEKFKKTFFYKQGQIFLNEQQENGNKDIKSLDQSIIAQLYSYNLKTGFTKSSNAFDKSDDISSNNVKEKEYKLIDFGTHIIRKAINKLEFYQFSNLKKYLPHLNSISEFITSTKYLGKIQLDIKGSPEQVEYLTPQEKLAASIKILEEISIGIANNRVEYKGSKVFKAYPIKNTFKDKTLKFTLNESEDKQTGRSMLENGSSYYLDLTSKDWYVFNDCFGTSEEKLLIKYIDKNYDSLKAKYSEVYLIRNEHHFKIFTFKDGNAIEPDFVLFLINRNDKKAINKQYQIFIEPKGDHLLDTDKWKEDFLKTLKEEYQLEKLYKDKDYIIWGLPFFNESNHKTAFIPEFKKLIE